MQGRGTTFSIIAVWVTTSSCLLPRLDYRAPGRSNQADTSASAAMTMTRQLAADGGGPDAASGAPSSPSSPAGSMPPVSGSASDAAAAMSMTAGAPCSQLDLQLCTQAFLGPGLMICRNGRWVADSCGTDNHATCESDMPTSPGTCVSITNDACMGQAKGTSVCIDTSVFECDMGGRSYRRQTCSGDRPECSNGQCVCGAMCGGQCTAVSSDPKHCGDCDFDCHGSTCRNGFCQPVMVSKTNVNAMQYLNGQLYWVGTDVMSLDLTSHAVATLFANQRGTALVVDGSTLYWLDSDNGELKTSASGTVKSLATGLVQPSGLGADATSWYWLERSSGWTLHKLSKAGGTPTASRSFGDDNLAMLLVTSDAVYIALGEQGKIMNVTTNSDFLAVALGVTQLAADASHLYFSVCNGGICAVKRASRTGATALTTLVPEIHDSTWFAIDSQFVYWTDRDADRRPRVQRTNLDGSGTPSVVYLGDAAGMLGRIELAPTSLFLQLSLQGEGIWQAIKPSVALASQP